LWQAYFDGAHGLYWWRVWAALFADQMVSSTQGISLKQAPYDHHAILSYPPVTVAVALRVQ